MTDYTEELPFDSDIGQEQRRVWADRRAAEVDRKMRESCQLDDAPYWITRPSMFLEGGYVGRWGRERDFQRSRLYEAHTRCFPEMKEYDYPHQYESLEEAQEELDGTLSDPWFVARFGEVEVDLRRGRGQRSVFTHDTRILRLADHHLCRSVLLHEFTHALVPPPHASHGRLFVRILTELMVRWPLFRLVFSDEEDEVRRANRLWLEKIWAKYDVK